MLDGDSFDGDQDLQAISSTSSKCNIDTLSAVGQKWVKANRDLTANSRFPLVIGTYQTTNTCGILKLKFDKY